MKTNIGLKTTFAALCSATVILTATATGTGIIASPAFADVGADVIYPANFVRELTFDDGLTDYAANGQDYAFAVKSTLYVLSYDEHGDRKLSTYRNDSQITRVDYSDGKLFFESSLQSYVCEYENGDENISATLSPHDFINQDERWKVDVSGSVSYIINSDTGELSYNELGKPTVIDSGTAFKPFSLKICGNAVYAVKEESLYLLEGATATKVNLEYTDFSATKRIPATEARAALKTPDAEHRIRTGVIKGGESVYYTQIDPTGNDEYFKPIKTVKLDENEDKHCLVLCETGNAIIFATREGCYITAASNLTQDTYSALDNDWQADANGERIAYAVESCGVYASPYMSECTRITTLAAGSDNPVKVTGKVPVSVIGTEFYRVSFESENGTVTGFVAAGYLSRYSFAIGDKEPSNSGDEEFDYDTNVVSVVLAIVIVALVIFAALYLYIASTKKKKKKEKNKRTKDDNPPTTENE